MSRSARRLPSATPTSSFAWQESAVPTTHATSVVALFPRQPQVSVSDLPLPSVNAERLAAAEAAAHAKGYAAGILDGQSAATAQAGAVVKSLSTALGDLASLRSEMMRRTERDLVRLAIAMAEGIILREVDADRGLLLAMAQAAIARFGEKTTATVRLSELDFQLLLRTGELPELDGIGIVPDPGVPAGGCQIDTPFGVIDAGVGTQVRELSRALVGSEDIAEVDTVAAPYDLAAGA